MNIKNLILTAVMAVSSLSLFAGEPPTIMLLPDKTWCKEHGYGKTEERRGKERFVENYDNAFLDPTLTSVVTRLEGYFGSMGLKPKNYGATSEIDDEEEMEEEFFESDSSGSELTQSAYEQLLNKLRPDIIINIGWNERKMGFNVSYSFRITAKDSYSGKTVASIIGETPTVKVTVPAETAILEAANQQMSEFIADLRSHFDDVQEKGREVTLSCRIMGSSDVNFESEFGGEELGTLINNWVSDNTINHSYSQRNATTNRLQFEQCRIPLRSPNGGVFQAKQWVTGLQKYLKTLGIQSKNTTKGLGSGRLYIGEK
ncbi:MAG: hypothetical protein K2N03_03455 [Muribaculaceae bacterium]|nr:hypothetical protein [Muribaculaceae bacterium]